MLELDILHEIGRIAVTPQRVLEAAGEIGQVGVSDATFTETVLATRPLSWTRDPFDRLITATAIADGARLLTADKTILTHFADAVWD